MPIINSKIPPYKKSKEVAREWKTFRRGLNLLLRSTELGLDEMAQADEIMLTGSGVPTGRWGTTTYFTAGATGSIRGFGTYVSNDGSTNELFALTDQGYLQKKNSTSSIVITGQSWPSGSIIRTEQLAGKTYIASENAPFTSYDGSNLTVFATISAPTGVSATNFSGATGANSVSYKVQALGSNGGQTTPSTNYVLGSLPTILSDTEIHLFWTAPSAATLSGYEIFRGRAGDETWLAQVPVGTTKYVDRGDPSSDVIQPSITNTTGGVKSKFLIKFKDRLIAVNKDDPNFLMVSGRYPNHTKFNWADGGGGVYVDPDSGDNITGLAVQPISDKLLVFKGYASYLIELDIVQIGSYYVLDPKYTTVSTSKGASNQDTIQTVENDIFSFGRNGLQVTGYEPNFLNIVRTNEVSARMRPYLDDLNDDDYRTATSMYINNKYILSFPLKKEMIVYDRERGAFTGPWRTPYGISHMRKYIDGSGTENWVLGSYENNIVYTFNEGLNTDSGTIIIKKLRTGKVDFGDWTLLSIIQYFYILYRAIVGSVVTNILVETRTGETVTVKSFTISGSEAIGSTGYGNDLYGLAAYGLSTVFSANITPDEATRWGSIFKQARLVQVEVQTTETNSNFELLKIKLTGVPQGRGSLSSTQRV